MAAVNGEDGVLAQLLRARLAPSGMPLSGEIASLNMMNDAAWDRAAVVPNDSGGPATPGCCPVGLGPPYSHMLPRAPNGHATMLSWGTHAPLRAYVCLLKQAMVVALPSAHCMVLGCWC